MINLDERSHDAEIMDDLTCSGDVVHQTLRELEVINRRLGGNRVTLSGVAHLLRNDLRRNASIVDLGCGGGDMLKLISRWGRNRGLSLDLTGLDANPNIIAFASANAYSFPGIKFETINVFSNEFRMRDYDVFLATLFIHHFTDDQLVDLFRSMYARARIGIVVNDIQRHWMAYHSIRLLTWLWSKSSMVRYDAPLSVRRAFRRQDLERIMKRADIRTYRLDWRWAFRWRLIIETR